MKIDFAGHEFILHPAGVLLWPVHRTLIVSDLHLEKGSHFALRGFFLPPYDSEATLTKLLALCDDNGIDRVIIMGDCFHDAKGYARLPDKARQLFDRLCGYELIWIKGNHDGDFAPEQVHAYELFEQEDVYFRHQAVPQAENEISGHFHPKITLVHKGAVFTRPCFVENGVKLLLPAFGAYTGGMDVKSEAIARNFFGQNRYYVLGEEKIYQI